MKGLEITDATKNNVLSFDLFDILNQLGFLAKESRWIISDVDCFGEAASEIEKLADSKISVSGDMLLDLASNLTQTIDGVFTGYRLGEVNPWIIIQAIDSSSYEVFSTNDAILTQLNKHFQSVIKIPDIQEWHSAG